MGFRRAAVVMAGGSGTRFWPVSTESRPKQFLRLASEGSSLLEQSVARAVAAVGQDVFIATSASLVAETGRLVPGHRVFGEPMRRNTLGALVWAVANIENALGSEVSLAVLTADHMISPTAGFVSTVEKALSLAEESGALVTIGIGAARPATEYGYVEMGEEVRPGAWRAKRFTEKPDLDAAEEFVASGRFLWNSGMFFWTIPAFATALNSAQPSAHQAMVEISSSLATGDVGAAEAAFERLDSISIDYALMENAKDVAVVRAEFDWDDLGSWDALSRSLPLDERGNAVQGRARVRDSSGSVVYNETEQRVNLLGMEDVVVVVTDGEVMVCPKDRAQDVRGLAVDD